MKISYNWLKEYIKTDLQPVELGKMLTDIGLEVENIEKYESFPGTLNGFFIGKVLTCEKHPNADKLSKTTVDIGGNTILPIVCGAPNVAAGQTVIVATVGAKVQSPDGEFPIKKAKIRGEESIGMICAEDEIGIGSSHEGIIVLNDDGYEIGKPLDNYLQKVSDTVFEIGLTPNHAAAASHIGVARDLKAALLQRGTTELSLPDVSNFKIDNNNLPIKVIVENAEACPRYSGITLSDIKVKESPQWLQHKLKALGLTPINNVVDATNFLLHEYGQPLHAFDAKAIKGNTVRVKTLNEGTPFVTLDEQERKLNANDLMICNESEGMCMAGVFGGISSGVTEKTTHIFLESACFDSVYIRKTSKHHALQTDASYRFERGTDPNITVTALKRAAMLIKELAGGTISSEIVDVYPNPVAHRRVTASFSRINKLIGKELDKETVTRILQNLEIEIVSVNGDALVADVPPYRVDVTREADLVEEVLRIYGYNNVEITDRVHSSLSYLDKPDREKLHQTIAQMLTAQDFAEMMSNSLTKMEYYTENQVFAEENTVKILNPLSADLGAMRQTLLYGGLEAIAHNKNRKNFNLKLYEFGNIYSYKSGAKWVKSEVEGYFENTHLDLFVTGDQQDENWLDAPKPADFYFLKSMVDRILQRFGIEAKASNDCDTNLFDYGQKLQLKIGNNKIELGQFGKISGKITKPFDIENPVFYANLRWDLLVKAYTPMQTMQPLSKFPEVRRDLALLLDKSVEFAQIKEIAYQVEKKLLKSVRIFDVFEHEKLGENKKSYAVSFILQDDTKTLKDNQIDKIMNKLIARYQNDLDARIR